MLEQKCLLILATILSFCFGCTSETKQRHKKIEKKIIIKYHGSCNLNQHLCDSLQFQNSLKVQSDINSFFIVNIENNSADTILIPVYDKNIIQVAGREYKRLFQGKKIWTIETPDDFEFNIYKIYPPNNSHLLIPINKSYPDSIKYYIPYFKNNTKSNLFTLMLEFDSLIVNRFPPIG